MTSRPSTAAPILAMLAIALVTLPVLYVLSMGPIAWLYWHGYVSEELIDPYGYPVQLGLDNSEWFYDAYHAYLKHWIPANSPQPP